MEFTGFTEHETPCKNWMYYLYLGAADAYQIESVLYICPLAMNLLKEVNQTNHLVLTKMGNGNKHKPNQHFYWCSTMTIYVHSWRNVALWKQIVHWLVGSLIKIFLPNNLWDTTWTISIVMVMCYIHSSFWHQQGERNQLSAYKQPQKII